MNNARREELLEVCQYLDDAVDRLCEIREDEEYAFDNLPEGLQCSIRGDAMQEAIADLEGFEDAIVEVRNQIQEYATPKKRRK